MKVQLFNGLYFLFIFIYILITIACDFFLRNKSDKFRYRFILIMTFIGFSLHFIKQFFEPYRSDFPYSLKKSTFENICAVSTLIFPFIFMSKSKALKDYMGIIGMLSGCAAVFFPTEVLDKNPFTFDGIRFYICHLIIFLAPYLMVRYHLHELSYKRLIHVPVGFLIVLGVIVVNEVILMGTNLVEPDIEKLFDPNYRNSSLIFGISDNLKPAGFLLDSLCPKIFKYNPITHEKQYWPLVWIVIPVFVYAYLFGFLICMIFSFKEIKKDFTFYFSKIKVFFSKMKKVK